MFKNVLVGLGTALLGCIVKNRSDDLGVLED